MQAMIEKWRYDWNETIHLSSSGLQTPSSLICCIPVPRWSHLRLISDSFAGPFGPVQPTNTSGNAETQKSRQSSRPQQFDILHALFQDQNNKKHDFAARRLRMRCPTEITNQKIDFRCSVWNRASRTQNGPEAVPTNSISAGNKKRRWSWINANKLG